MSKTGWLGLAVVVIAAAGLWWWLSPQTAPAPQGAPSATAQDAGNSQGAVADASAGVSGGLSATTGGASTQATVSYDGSSFSPASITIAKGGTVTFTDTAGSMWVASNQHPSHTLYDGTSRAQHCSAGYSGSAPFDQCGPGSTFSFTFNKAGTWDYHDHLNAGAQGTVVVQ